MSFEGAILQELRAGGHRGSVITTFNVNFPFYEEVVLRKLVAAGCRHNVLIVDSRQFSRSLADESSRPSRAGHDYTLIPLRVPGAFHPKIALLGGRRKGCLLVGSHNVTLAGFGKNRELTNRIQIDSAEDHEGTYLGQEAWKYMCTWVKAQAPNVPEEIAGSVLKLSNQIPWLAGTGTPNDIVGFYGSTPVGSTLFEQVAEQLPGSCTAVIGLAPFFDKDFKMLAALHERFPAAKLIVGIDPETADVRSASWPKFCRFVDASDLGAQTGYLHAKALLFRGRRKKDILVTGSANLSSVAWDAPPGSRNAEAVITFAGRQAIEAAEALGLMGLADMPELSQAARRAIADRAAREKVTTDQEARPHTFAVAANSVIRLASCGSQVLIGDEIRFLSRSGVQLLSHSVTEYSENGLEIAVDGAIIGNTVSLEVVRDKQVVLTAIVHHKDAIHRLSLTGKRARLHDALASLGSDNPDLEGLISIVDKIIFDEQKDEIELRLKRGATGRRAAAEGDEIESLGVHLSETETQRRKRRLVRAGSFGELLDVLIYQLGLGLERSFEQRDHKGRSEEEQKDADDEDEDDNSADIDGEALVASCQRKVTGLVGRLIRQLARAKAGEHTATHAVFQVLAVLAVLRELRILEGKTSWVPDGATLVPGKERHRLFTSAVAAFFGKDDRLLAKCLEELSGDEPDELDRLPGLLVWLAWDSGVRLREEKPFNELPEETKSRVFQKALLLSVLNDACQSEVALDEVRASVQWMGESSDAIAWLRRHETWVQRLQTFSRKSAVNVDFEDLEPGDVVCRLADPDQLHVVASATSGKVFLINPAGPGQTVQFLSQSLRIVEAACAA